MTTDHVISCEGFDIIISFKVNVVKHGQNSVGADLLGIKSPRSTTGNEQDVYKEHKSGVYKEIDQTDDKKSNTETRGYKRAHEDVVDEKKNQSN